MSRLRQPSLVRTWRSTDWWITVLVSAALIAAAFAFAAHYLRPLPPTRIVMATGPEGGAYEGFAKAYKTELAKEGIELDLRPTNGAVDNLRLLKDDNADVSLAFVQGGIAKEEDGQDLMSLAALYYEPVWIFYRGAPGLDRLSALRGKTLAVGRMGSGARALAQQLMQANGLRVDDGQGAGDIRWRDMTPAEALEALQTGQVDAAFIVGAPESSIVARLMRMPGVQLMSLTQAEAYSRQFAFLSHVVLPEGSFDLGTDLPVRDVHLVAPTANLVVRDDIHPALVTLLVEVAADIHGGAGLLHKEGEFPTPKGVDVPMSLDAERQLKLGPSFLHQHLPFWIAVWVDRLVVLLIPLLAVVVPVLRLAPALYAWRVKSRIHRWYGRLKELEYEIELAGSHFDAAAAAARLDGIERGASEMHTPLPFAENLYNLRAHIELVRQRLERKSAVTSGV